MQINFFKIALNGINLIKVNNLISSADTIIEYLKSNKILAYINKNWINIIFLKVKILLKILWNYYSVECSTILVLFLIKLLCLNLMHKGKYHTKLIQYFLIPKFLYKWDYFEYRSWKVFLWSIRFKLCLKLY